MKLKFPPFQGGLI